MAHMQHRAVTAVREWNERLGPDAIYAVVSHGDVIKAILADALGMHLDQFQRLRVDPCSVSIVDYTPLRPFVARTNDVGGSLAGLVPPAAEEGPHGRVASTQRRATPSSAGGRAHDPPGASTTARPTASSSAPSACRGSGPSSCRCARATRSRAWPSRRRRWPPSPSASTSSSTRRRRGPSPARSPRRPRPRSPTPPRWTRPSWRSSASARWRSAGTRRTAWW